MFRLGIAIFFCVEESHDDAIERVAMIGAEAVGAVGAVRAVFPERSVRGGVHEGDAAGHGQERKTKLESRKWKMESRN
jgi:hypothetical protein